MVIICKTLREANVALRKMRALYAGTDWTVRISLPLYPGDAYRVVVA